MSTGDAARPPSDPRLRQPAGLRRWQPRRKRAARRLRNDLRHALPIVGVVLCFGLSAGAIFATEWLPVDREALLAAVPTDHSERPECRPRGAAARSGAASRSVATLAEAPEIVTESAPTPGLRAARPRR